MTVNLTTEVRYFGKNCQSHTHTWRVVLHYASGVVESVEGVESVDGGRAVLVFWIKDGPPMKKSLDGLEYAEVI